MIRIVAATFLVSSVSFHSVALAQVSSTPDEAIGAATILLTPSRRENGELVRDGDGNVMYAMLIADHTNDRGHAPLGGTIETGESARVCAARETSEESRNVLSESKIYELVRDAPELLAGKIAVYVIVIDYVDPSEFDNAPEDCDGCEERVGYVWVPVRVVDQIIASDDKKIPKQHRSIHSHSDSMSDLFAKIYPATRRYIGDVIKSDREARADSR